MWFTANWFSSCFNFIHFRFLVFREFVTDQKGNNSLVVSEIPQINSNWIRLTFWLFQKIHEKFRRNELKVFHEDILKRTFDIAENKIILQFHYGKDDVTPTIRTYTSPAKPDYGCEILFNEEDNPVDEVYLHENLRKTLFLLFPSLSLSFFHSPFCCFFDSFCRPINTSEMYQKSNDITCYLSNFGNRIDALKHSKSDCCTLNQQLLNIKIMLSIRFWQQVFMMRYEIRYRDQDD